jgi:uncharacterized RDD family membrane protein YckC
MMPRIQLGSLMGRLVVFAAIASSFVWAFWYQHEDIGSFTEIKDGVTHVSAATSPQAVLMSLLGLVVYCVLLNTHVMEQNFRIASMWKRAAAFVVDFWFAVFTLGALFGLIDILLEASRTGVFRWHFQRDYLVSSDGVSLVLVFVGLAAVVSYFLLPLMRRSQTLGCWIFRLVTVNSDGYVIRLPLSTALRRLFAEFRGLCSPLRTFRKRDENGRTFYDIDSGFTVVSY